MAVSPLSSLNSFSRRPGPVVLMIMDGVGIGKEEPSNAVYAAKTPVLDKLMSGPLVTQLKAHGTAVGMPTDEDMGNSEVGHNALGAGRVFDQGAALVKHAINSGSIFEGQTWNDVVFHVNDQVSTLHFIGLLSDGNVHSHIDHLIAMLEQARIQEVARVRVHILLDGRDVAGRSALGYIETLEATLASINETDGYDYRIASGGGRMITTMDRYHADWSIVERGWRAHVLGEAQHFGTAQEAVQTFYNEDDSMIDQYLPSFVIAQKGQPIGTIEDGDGVIFFNFRGDRAIEISEAFESKDFEHFHRVRVPDVMYAGMMEYDGDLHVPSRYLVDPPAIDHPVGEYMCASGISSFAISETQKYGHVTYFWNGNNSGYINRDLEEYVEIESDRIPFDQRPEMKAYEITEKSIELLKSGRFQFGRINFPNGDMVGHTGNLEAAITSVEVTDDCVGKIVDVIRELNGVAVILADHGNADVMVKTKNGVSAPHTAHTLNPVPFIIVDTGQGGAIRLSGVDQPGLANVAATLCNLLGFAAPEDYEPSLVSVS